MNRRFFDSSRVLNVAAIVGLCLAAIAPYIPSLKGGFVWDDTKLILEDHRFEETNPVEQLLTTDFFGQTEEAFRYGYLRPLTSLSYYLSWKAFGRNPLPFRLSNLVMHIGVTLLIFLFALRLYPTTRFGPWLGAALFALHPVHANSVAWIAGRTDLLCALLMLPMLVLIIPGQEKWPPRLLLLGSIFSFGLSLWAKEMALSLPAALLVFSVFLPRERGRKRWFLLSLGSLAATFPYLFFRFLATDVGLREAHWDFRLLLHLFWTFCATFLRYCRELLIPLRTEPYIQNPWRDYWMDPWVIGGSLLLLVVGATAWKLRKKETASSWLLVFFVISFLPVSNIFRITGPPDMGAPMAQRFLYIPSIAFCILSGRVISRLLHSSSSVLFRRMLAAATVVLLLGSGFMSYRASQPWMSDFSLFSTMVRQVPEAPLPRILLGTWLRKQGRYEKAGQELEKALSLLPDERAGERWTVLNNLAGVWLAKGQCDKAALCLDAADLANPENASIHHNMGLYQRACGSKAEAERQFSEALRIQPWRLKSRQQLGLVLLEEGRYAEGIDQLRVVLAKGGPRMDILIPMADAYGRMGHKDEALRILKQAAKLKPGAPPAELPLGMLLLSEGRTAEAAQTFERVLRLNPDYPPALHYKAMALGRQGKFNAASRCLQRALAFEPENLDFLLTLAQIEYAAGRKESAARYMAQAKKIAPDSGRLLSTMKALGLTEKSANSLTGTGEDS